MLPFETKVGGRFTSGGVAVNLNLYGMSEPNKVKFFNRTKYGTNSTQLIESEWVTGMAQDSYYGVKQLNDGGSNALQAQEIVLSNGFRIYNTANPPSYAGLATTNIDKTTFVTTMADTGSIAVGDLVRVANAVDMYQIGGIDMQVTAVTNDTSITFGYMATAAPGFATDGDSGTVIKFIQPQNYPRWRWIIAVSQAAQAVVQFSVNHNFTVGEKVSFRIPKDDVASGFASMYELNNKTASVLAVTANTITIDLDTSGYTAFAFPTSAQALDGIGSGQVCVPAGAGPKSGANPPEVPLNAAFDNRNVWVLHAGTDVIGANDDVFDWYAEKYSDYSVNDFSS